MDSSEATSHHLSQNCMISSAFAGSLSSWIQDARVTLNSKPSMEKFLFFHRPIAMASAVLARTLVSLLTWSSRTYSLAGYFHWSSLKSIPSLRILSAFSLALSNILELLMGYPSSFFFSAPAWPLHGRTHRRGQSWPDTPFPLRKSPSSPRIASPCPAGHPASEPFA